MHDVERYMEKRLGLTPNAVRDREREQISRYRRARDDNSFTEFPSGLFMPPGLFPEPSGAETSLAAGVTGARYLGPAPYDLSVVTLRLNITTAGVGLSWGEVGIGVSEAADLADAAVISTAGWMDAATDFATVQRTNFEIGVDIAKGLHVWALYGSDGTTVTQFRGADDDNLGAGFMQFAAIRPSTMPDETAFTITLVASRSALLAAQW